LSPPPVLLIAIATSAPRKAASAAAARNRFTGPSLADLPPIGAVLACRVAERTRARNRSGVAGSQHGCISHRRRDCFSSLVVSARSKPTAIAISFIASLIELGNTNGFGARSC
jgi:hypothetical protein